MRGVYGGAVVSWWDALPGNTCPTIDQAKQHIETIADRIKDALSDLRRCEPDEDGLVEAAIESLDGLDWETDSASSLLEDIRTANSDLRSAAEERGKACEELDNDCDQLRAERDEAREERDSAREDLEGLEELAS